MINRLAILPVVLIAALAASVPPATRPTYATPADVVAAAQQANRAKDVPAQIDVLSPAGQKQMTKFLVTILTRGRPTTLPAEKQAEKDAFLAKHHLTDPKPHAGETPAQAVDRLVGAVPDPRAFLIDFATNEAKNRRPAPPSTKPAPELKNVVIAPDGLTATADLTSTSGNGTMSQKLKFSKVDGSWLLDVMMFY